MQEHPVAVDPARQEHGVLVLGGHDHPQAREAPEVLGLGERHAWAFAAEHGVGDDPAVQLLDEGDARILEAPLLLGVRAVIGERGVIVDDQFEAPSRERAHARCEKPRRSSTRHSSTVSSPTLVAPAFMMAELRATRRRSRRESSVFGDPIGDDAFTVTMRCVAFVLVAAAALIPGPTRVRAGRIARQELFAPSHSRSRAGRTRIAALAPDTTQSRP